MNTAAHISPASVTENTVTQCTPLFPRCAIEKITALPIQAALVPIPSSRIRKRIPRKVNSSMTAAIQIVARIPVA